MLEKYDINLLYLMFGRTYSIYAHRDKRFLIAFIDLVITSARAAGGNIF